MGIQSSWYGPGKSVVLCAVTRQAKNGHFVDRPIPLRRMVRTKTAVRSIFFGAGKKPVQYAMQEREVHVHFVDREIPATKSPFSCPLKTDWLGGHGEHDIAIRLNSLFAIFLTSINRMFQQGRVPLLSVCHPFPQSNCFRHHCPCSSIRSPTFLLL